MAGDSLNEQNISIMKPQGVWVIISPFNFPIALAAGMVSAALLTGITVVFKPTSKASLAGFRLYSAFLKSGVPAGAINVVTGPGKPFGEVVVAHPDVDGITFTGSRAVGTFLQRQFIAKQPYPKPIISEMGSKNPAIVTAHADLDKAVEGVIKGGRWVHHNWGRGINRRPLCKRLLSQTNNSNWIAPWTSSLQR